MEIQHLPEQVFLYQVNHNSAELLRCFSQQDTAVIPSRVDGLPVESLSAYCFSARKDAAQFWKASLKRGIKVAVTGPESRKRDLFASRLREMAGREEQEGADAFAQLCKTPDTETGFGLLAGEALLGVRIGDGVKRAGNYCFYDCGALSELSFPATLTDWGSGVFTGCHRIRDIRVAAEPGERTMLKDVLDELPEALTVWFCRHETPEDPSALPVQTDPFGRTIRERPYACLTFPEFYEEGVENTPARILETHVHGSGILYRNCFRERRYDYHEYDRLFPYAKAQEDPALVEQLVTGRLFWPWDLEEPAREKYEAWLLEERQRLGRQYIGDRQMEKLRSLTGLILLRCRENALPWLEEMISYAGSIQAAAEVSYLMEQRNRTGRERNPAGAGRRRLEL